jgi:uncharacterized 2Fe-2S/4Fe-4S cluster protein (DUF4445 family)
VPREFSGHGKDIAMSRTHVNEIQLAIAALQAGQEILISKACIEAANIDEIITAGAFGSYIDVPNEISVGMFPDIPLKRFRQIGNAGGMGAMQALISGRHRSLIKDVIKDVEFVELTTYENFQREFVEAM